MEQSAVYAYRAQATLKDYPGCSCALFFTPGCNFRCGFCHNADLFSAEGKYSWEKLEGVLKGFRKQWVHAATITGGEPTLHEELPETIDFFKKHGFKVKLDSNGSNPAMLEKVLPMVDYLAMDIKCSLANYKALTGYDRLDTIRASIALIMAQAKDYEFRTTIIESVHSDEELRAGAEAIRGAKRYILQPFVPHEELPREELRIQPRTRPSFLEHALQVVREIIPQASIRDN